MGLLQQKKSTATFTATVLHRFVTATSLNSFRFSNLPAHIFVSEDVGLVGAFVDGDLDGLEVSGLWLGDTVGSDQMWLDLM